MNFLLAAEIGMQTLLDGGISALLLAALGIVSKLYYNEKTSKDSRIKTLNELKEKQIEELNQRYSDKVDLMYRERLTSETENVKIVMHATEVLENVTGILQKTTALLEELSEN